MAVFRLVEEDRLEDRDELRQPRRMGRRGDADYAVGVWVGNCSGEGRPLMTGVGYAAPVLFEVFGLLPGSEWFAEPYDDLEPAVVCRQSGFLASQVCPDRDTLMIPRTAAPGEVCPYHRIVNLSPDLKYRVTTDCCDRPYRPQA